MISGPFACAAISSWANGNGVTDGSEFKLYETTALWLTGALDSLRARDSASRLCYSAFMEPVHSDHSRLDERSLTLHRLIAEKLRADPALLDKARANVRRWQAGHDSPSFALAEWEQILSGTVDQVAKFLAERSEKATRLRQSSPFTGILTEAERLAIYESHSTRTYHPGGKPNLG